jgi:hypothetical protein
MIESKIGATERLRREGRLEAASIFRDGKRRLLRDGGMSRKEAVEASWEAMLIEFTPLPESTPSEPATSGDDGRNAAVIEEILLRPKTLSSDIISDVAWVYGHVGDDEVKPDAVPSLGAWSMWRWAKENRNEFFEGIWPKAAAAKGNRDKRQVELESDPIMAHLEHAVAEDRRRWREELAADLPARIKGDVDRWLDGIPDRFDVELSDEAIAGLTRRMIDLSREYVAAGLESPEAYRHEK